MPFLPFSHLIFINYPLPILCISPFHIEAAYYVESASAHRTGAQQTWFYNYDGRPYPCDYACQCMGLKNPFTPGASQS